MEPTLVYLWAADVLLVIHFMVALFIVLGLIFIFLGKWREWGWVRNPWFRTGHLLAITMVVVQAWMGRLCPLTTWEMSLRKLGGGSLYSQSFIGHWVGKLLYYQAPPWVFTCAYTIFGAMVLASWVWVRPRKFKQFIKDSD